VTVLDGGAGVVEIATAVRGGQVSALDVAQAALHRVEGAQTRLNAFTTVTAERALTAAADIDRRVAAGDPVGALAGVPFAVKDLFDLAGEVTAAGSAVLANRPPAERDAAAVERLTAADAVPIGATTMDEFAFGFTTENTHYGPARNPHDPARTPGGSSGGSAAAVAGGLVPLALGTDTNGSVRVPASLCGLFGLKPTYGRLDRRGVQLFSDSLDHVGAFARSARDLRAWFSVADEGVYGKSRADGGKSFDVGQLRVARLGGWFQDNAGEAALDALSAVADAMGADRTPAVLPLAEAAHAAASVITYAEAGELHLDRIRNERDRFDPVVRHRLVAAALLPADWYLRAQRLRQVWVDQLDELFGGYDVLLAPATPFPAPVIGTETVEINGRDLPARPAVGWLTQPLTPTGVPIGVAPMMPAGSSMPIGVQVIAKANNEPTVLAVLAALEDLGVTTCVVASGQAEQNHNESS
jgi:AtzE family amidohydrolase